MTARAALAVAAALALAAAARRLTRQQRPACMVCGRQSWDRPW